MTLPKKIDPLFDWFFNERLKVRIEHGILYIATIGFLVHLAFVFLHINEFILVPKELHKLLGNPIAAIYTPFSFILIYEVYLLIYYLPRSFSISIAKQYEIVSLILIRRIFKDISYLDVNPLDVGTETPNSLDLFTTQNLNLLYDIIGFLLLFFLIFVFRFLLVRRKSHHITPNIQGFILYKKVLCLALIPVFLGLALFSFGDWSFDIYRLSSGENVVLTDFNNIFYHEFFTALIIVDVLILVASFRYTDRYSLIIRNTGFVITTVLIRVSFSTTGLTNIVLLVSGILFGVMVLWLYSLYDKIDKGDSTKESYAYL